MERDSTKSVCSRSKAATALIGAAALAAVLSTAGAADTRSHRYSEITENGHYRVTLSPVPEAPPIAKLHDWIVHIETRDGSVFTPTQLGITGGMPAHAHGFVSEPRVTESRGNGDYLIEGMKFHMGGDWQITVGLSGPAGFDRAVIDISVLAGFANVNTTTADWSDGEMALLQSFSLDALQVSRDPSNRFSGNYKAAKLGEKLFFDKELSSSGTISCATCHDPARKFTDGKKRSFGTQETARNSPSLIGVAQGEWFYWDGRRDSLWAQAVTPIETPGEMDNSRVNAVAFVMTKYGALYEEIVGHRFEIDETRYPKNAGPYARDDGKKSWYSMSAPERDAINQAFANIGKFLAAYIESLEPKQSRFDRFVAALATNDVEQASRALDQQELAGLKLFLDSQRTQCVRCHNGPMFTNHGFHNIATGIADNGMLDFGRMIGVQAALVDEFNCRGKYSDVAADECAELRFAESRHASRGAFKVPSLRNVALTGPYMHDGRFATLREVIDFYTRTPDADVGEHELPRLELSVEEIEQLTAFLKTLSDAPGY